MPNWNQSTQRIRTSEITTRPTVDIPVDVTREVPIVHDTQACALVEPPHLTIRRGDPLRIIVLEPNGLRRPILSAYCTVVITLTLTITKILVGRTELPPISRKVLLKTLGYDTQRDFDARYNPYSRHESLTLVQWR